MRDPNRLYPFYAELQRVHITHFPDWRFGQLCHHFQKWITIIKEKDPFYVEEDKMLEYLKEFVGEIKHVI